MNAEILSIETAKKIARLEKENKEYEEIIIKFDKEINRQFKVIKNVLELLNSYKQDLDSDFDNEKETVYITIETAINILEDKREVQNV